MHADFAQNIYFSNVWEDYTALADGLDISAGDRMLSISSAGDNVFNLLLTDPAEVVAVDDNPHELALTQFKHHLLSSHSQTEILQVLERTQVSDEFVQRLKRKIPSREIFQPFLAAERLEAGVSNIGVLEERALPALQSLLHHVIEEESVFTVRDWQQQKSMYRNNRIWIQLISFLFSRKIFYRYLFPGFASHFLDRINVDIRKQLLTNLKQLFHHNDFSENWYLQKMYYGNYRLLPPFLREENIETVRNRLDRIEYRRRDVLDYLKEQPTGTIDKINLSDIFDWCSEEEYENILVECQRVLASGGRLFYRELFVTRALPPQLQQYFMDLDNLAERLHRTDNTPLYHRIRILERS